jgi:Ca2+-dependent lipid-binding protein
VVTVGSQTYRTRTATDGGRNPVWNETFRFNVINENTVLVKLMDEDTMARDDLLGQCTISLAKVRWRPRPSDWLTCCATGHLHALLRTQLHT